MPEGAPSDSGKETEVSSHTLDDSERSSLQQEAWKQTERDYDGDGESEQSEQSGDSESEKGSEESGKSEASSRSEEDWEKPSTNPWRRFSDLVSALEPWNSRLWHGLPSSLRTGFAWDSVWKASDELRCSLVYASVMFRSYRRKCVRFVNASLAARTVSLSCPKRPLRPTASPPEDL